jgi:hypothetical protein
MTLSFFAYNIVSYINGLFKDLECELYTLSIAMQTFIEIMDKIAQIETIVNRKEILSFNGSKLSWDSFWIGT